MCHELLYLPTTLLARQHYATFSERFRGLPISRGATIHRAYLQFEADEEDPGPASLMIEAEASDDSPPLTTGLGDISSRVRTSAWAGWSPPDWNDIGETSARQRTSDLSGVIQEVVDRAGWTPGAAMTLIISALDLATNRTATAHDASPQDAPILHVDFTPIRPDVTITAPTDGAAAIEAELLGGQKLQGTLTAKEVNHILKMKGLEHEFPFFTTVYKISYEDTPLSAITETPY